MKSTKYISLVLCGTGSLVLMLGTTGCEMMPSSAPAGAPANKPAYVATDAPQEGIPRVQSPYAKTTVAAIPYVNKALPECKNLGDAAVGVLPEYLLEAGFQPVEASGSDLNAAPDGAAAAKIGGQLGAKYVFVGEINSYRVVKPESNHGFKFGSWALDTAGGDLTYDLQVSGRLVEVETRAIIASKTVAYSQTFKVAGKGAVETPWGKYSQGQSANMEHEIGGKVMKVALNRLVSQIATQLNTRAQ